VLANIFKPRSKERKEMKKYFEFVGEDKSRKSEAGRCGLRDQHGMKHELLLTQKFKLEQ
jgi:hypothetical protein